ncbi:NADP-dependent oxidoreductase [Streptomyces parvulus]|uniref:NADP-dependent oxidoreductase n=1 Tax=Streptomyces parvulus TaxID=146923 RepID=UPI0037BE0611
MGTASAGVVVADAVCPEPGRRQVLVLVKAAGINPVDVEAVRAGPFGRTLGWEAAGLVDAVGRDVRGLRPGDAVIGWTYWFASGRGTQAEYAVLDAAATVSAPRTLDAVRAATVPLNGTTAWQALVELGMEPGESLIVVGAAGSIGGFAVDLAVSRGCEVWGVAAARDAGFVTGRGARFADRDDEPGTATLGTRFDAMLATAPVDGAWQSVLRPTGRFLSTVGQSLPDFGGRFLNAHPDAGALSGLAALVDRGELRTRVARRYPLVRAPEAYAEAASPGARGRVVLVP